MVLRQVITSSFRFNYTLQKNINEIRKRKLDSMWDLCFYAETKNARETNRSLSVCVYK